MQVVTDNKNDGLQEIKDHLQKIKHPDNWLLFYITNSFQSKKQESNDKNVITFTRIYNPNHRVFLTNLKIALKHCQQRTSKSI